MIDKKVNMICRLALGDIKHFVLKKKELIGFYGLIINAIEDRCKSRL
jgi:hypothetical protein